MINEFAIKSTLFCLVVFFGQTNIITIFKFLKRSRENLMDEKAIRDRKKKLGASHFEVN